ncbi:MAG: putative lipoprotein [Candidatus Methylumidiphilus sp.]
MPPRPLPLALLSAAVLSACSFSDSSTSSVGSSASLGKMIASPFTSSSRSSESPQQTYTREVADYTADYVQSSSAKIDSFRVKIGKLAAASGIANWEEDKATYVAIGKGLRQAGLGQPQYEAFKASLGGGEAWKAQAIAEGFGK